MHTAVKLTCVGLMAVLAGCSSLNPFATKAEPRNPPAALVDFKPTMPVRTAWTASVGAAGAFAFTPALANDSLYVAAANGS
ncbi:MAG: outer membrane protein assembly factor BamB, partial [Burkholderiales bacterium]